MDVLLKLQLIDSGDNPLIRITYKDNSFDLLNRSSKNVIRDVVKSDIIHSFWIFVDNGKFVNNFESSITQFYKSGKKIYHVNGSQ